MAIPLTRKAAALAALALLALCTGTATILLRRDLARLPWNSRLALEFPRSALLAPDGDWIVLDSGDRRLMRLAPDGRARWITEGGRHGAGFYSGALLGIDGSGTLWLMNDIMDEQGGIMGDEILPVAPDGTVGEPVFTRRYEGDDRVDYTRHMFYGKLVGGSVTYFSMGEAGETRVFRVDPSSGKGEELVGSFDGIDAYADTVGAFALPDGTAYFMMPDGTIEAWRAEGMENVFDPAASSMVLRGPSELHPAPGGGMILLDDKRLPCALGADGELEPLMEEADATFFIPSFTVPASDSLALIDLKDFSLHALDLSSGKPSAGPASLRLPRGRILRCWAAWLGAAACLASAAAFILVFYLKVARRRTPILVKQLLIFLPLVIGSVVAVSGIIFSDMERRLFSEIETRLRAWGHLGAQFISGDDVGAIDPSAVGIAACIGREEFGRIVENLDRIVVGNAEEWSSAVFSYVYIRRGGQVYVFDQWDYFERYLPRAGMLETMDEGDQRISTYRDEYSAWYSSFTPLKDSKGAVTGILELTIDRNVFDEARDAYRLRLVLSVGVVAALLVLAFSAFTLILLRSIRKLNAGATRLSVGEYDTEVSIRTRDEIEDLGKAFNIMARDIKQSIQTVSNLNLANSKFVPREFLSSLGRESILEVALGDQVEKRMTVFFSDIRNFTDLSERMSPQENFEFLNQYLKNMGPRVREAGGFIDKYIGDAIMALFPRRPEDAVRAALSLFEGLSDFTGISIGVGIHTGKLMLGVIGEEERFDGTVISDAVNLASRIESLTKYYGVSVIISGQALEEIEDREFFRYRRLDLVKVKGRDVVTELVEVIPPGTPGAALKRETAERFDEAFRLYAAGLAREAGEMYLRIAKENPDDAPARLFLKRCQAFLGHGLPEGWDGVTRFSEK